MPAQTLTLKIVADAAGADSVLKKCTQSLKELGITAGNFEVNTLGGASSITSLGGAMRNAGVETFNGQLGMTCQKVFGVGLAVNAVTGAFKSMVGQWRHALDVQLELVAAERLLRVATEDGAAAFNWVKEKAYEFGISVSQVAHQYGVFSATAKETNLTLKEQQDIFESFIQTAAALGMTTQDSDRMFYALREILNKNQLRSEELVKQFGNIIPGAVRKAIQAFGQGEEAFRKAMQTGEIRGQKMLDWLKTYSKLLKKDFEGVAREGAESLQGSLGKLKDAVELLYHEVGKGEGFSQLSEAIRNLGDELRKPETLAQMRSIGSAIGDIGKKVAGALKFLYDFRFVIVGIGAAMAAMKILKWATDLGKFIGTFLDGSVQIARAEALENSITTKTIALKKLEALARLDNAAKTLGEARSSVEKIMTDKIAAGAVRDLTMRQAENTLILIRQREATLSAARAKLVAAGAAKTLGAAINTAIGPIGWIVLAVSALATAMSFLKQKTNEATDALEAQRIEAERQREKESEKNRALGDSIILLDKERLALEKSKMSTEDLNKARTRVKDIIFELGKNAPAYLEILKDEKLTQDGLATALRTVIQLRKDDMDAKLKSARFNKKYYAEEEKRFNQMAHKATIDGDYKKRDEYWKLAADSKKQYDENKKLVDEYEHEKEKYDIKITQSAQEEKGGKTQANRIMSQERFEYEMLGHRLARLKIDREIGELATTELKIAKAREDAEIKIQDAEYKHKGELLKIDESQNLNKQMKEKSKIEAELNLASEKAKIRRDEAAEIQKIYADDKENREAMLEKLADAEEAFWDDIETHSGQGLDRRYAKIDIWAKKEKEKLDEIIAQWNELTAKGMLEDDVRKRLGVSGPIDREAREGEIDRATSGQKNDANERATEHSDSRLKKEMDELKKKTGSLSLEEFNAQVKDLEKEWTSSKLSVDAFWLAVERLKKEIQFDGKWYEGFGRGLDDYLKANANHFQNFASTTQGIVTSLEGAMSGAFESIFQRGTTGAEKWKAAWEGLRNSVIKSIGDILAKELVATTLGAALAKIRENAAKKEAQAYEVQRLRMAMAAIGFTISDSTATAIINANSQKRQAENVKEAGTAVVTAGANATESGAKMPFPYNIIAIAAGLAAVIAAITSIKGMAFAEGGTVTRPTLALLGEARQTEFVTPRETFKDAFFDFGETLAYNIMRRQDEANAYREWTAKTIQSAESGGMKQSLIVNHYSIEDPRNAAGALNKLLTYYARMT